MFNRLLFSPALAVLVAICGCGVVGTVTPPEGMTKSKAKAIILDVLRDDAAPIFRFTGLEEDAKAIVKHNYELKPMREHWLFLFKKTKEYKSEFN